VNLHCGFADSLDELRAGPAIFQGNTDELPAVAESAILYEAALLAILLAVSRFSCTWSERQPVCTILAKASDGSSLMQVVGYKGRE